MILRAAAVDASCSLSWPRNRVCHVHAVSPWAGADPQIATAIAAMYGARKTERPLPVQIRDRLGEWLEDERFAAAFGTRGKPGLSPSRLALVTILQRAENLTNQQAAEAARTRIDWKYLLGLSLDDPGFDHTVLAEFRSRVADAGLEWVVLDALLERLAAAGLVKAGGKLYLDSVLDVGSRRVLGFALGEHHDAELAYGALVMAVAVRGGAVPGVIFHTDQGARHLTINSEGGWSIKVVTARSAAWARTCCATAENTR